MTLFALTNARPIYTYSSAAGYRSAYPSYCGQWTIAWPIGKLCVVSFSEHDSHSAVKDVYPPAFPARVDKCIEMLAGVVLVEGHKRLAFPGRTKKAGPWVLRERKKGFPGAHGSRHLYNMMGGKVYDVDLLVLEKHETSREDSQEEMLRLQVSCIGEAVEAILFVPDHEKKLLDNALDSLPWTSLSWSMHRGMRDILLAHGKKKMDLHRRSLADILSNEVKQSEDALKEKGWDIDFVRLSIPQMVRSSILSRGGNSGDLVRIIIAVAECYLDRCEDEKPIEKGNISFWRTSKTTLDSHGIVALCKFFVLEWSQELDYQLYHQLPVELFLA